VSVVSLVRSQPGHPTSADLVAVYETLDKISQRNLLDEAWRLADEERDLDREARWPH
jgi:hypothetical protein